MRKILMLASICISISSCVTGGSSGYTSGGHSMAMGGDPASFHEPIDYIPGALGNYSWKITGASESQARGVPEWLRHGQGRWRRNAQEPCLMVRRYIQSTLRAKLSTSDYGVHWQDWDCQ